MKAVKNSKSSKSSPYICDYAFLLMYNDPRSERIDVADAKRMAETPLDVCIMVCRIVEQMGLPVVMSDITYP
jgi:hypothetical protein